MNTSLANQIRLYARAGAALLALGLSASPVGAGEDRPYDGRCSTIVTPISESQLHIAGDCRLTHLGAAKADTLQTVMPMGPPMMGMLMLHIVNDTTYRAANGDLLTMKFTGHGHLDLATGHVHYMGVESFTGGTGRFAAASGMASVEGTASVVTNVGQFVSKGRISY
jgi:hypothetical protein